MSHPLIILGLVALLVTGLLYWVYELGARSEREKQKREVDKKKEDRWGGWHL